MFDVKTKRNINLYISKPYLYRPFGSNPYQHKRQHRVSTAV